MRGSGSTGASEGTVCTHSNDAKCNRAASICLPATLPPAIPPYACVSVLSRSSHAFRSSFSRESLRRLNTHDKCFYISPAPIQSNGSQPSSLSNSCDILPTRPLLPSCQHPLTPPPLHHHPGYCTPDSNDESQKALVGTRRARHLSAHLRRSKSITCTTLLKKQAATLSPVLFHATSKIPEPPLSVLTKAPLLTSHICRHLSKDPEASRSPDGLKATL